MAIQVGTSATLTWSDVETLSPNTLQVKLQQDPWNKINSLVLELNRSRVQHKFWLGNKLAGCIKEIALPSALIQRIKHTFEEKGLFRKPQAEIFFQNQSKVDYSVERSFTEGHYDDVLWQIRAFQECRLSPNSPHATPLLRFLCAHVTRTDTSLYKTIGKLIAAGANIDEQHPETKTIPLDDFISNGGNIADLFADICDLQFRQRADSYLDVDLREIGAALPGETLIAMSDLSVRLSWMQVMIQHNTTELLAGRRVVALAQFIEKSHEIDASVIPSGEPEEDQLAAAAQRQLLLAAELLAKIPAQQQDFLNALSPNFRRTFTSIYFEMHHGLTTEKEMLVGKLYALKGHLGSLFQKRSDRLAVFFKLSTEDQTMQVMQETSRRLGDHPNSNKIAQVLSEILSLALYINGWLQQADLTQGIACLKEISMENVSKGSKPFLKSNSQHVDLALTTGEITRLKYQTLQKMLLTLEPKGTKWEDLVQKIDRDYPQVDLDVLLDKIFENFDPDSLDSMPDKKKDPRNYDQWAQKVGNTLEHYALTSFTGHTTLSDFLLKHFPPPRSAIKRGIDKTDLKIEQNPKRAVLALD